MVDMENIQFTVFEIVPSEKISKRSSNSLYKKIVSVLKKFGLEENDDFFVPDITFFSSKKDEFNKLIEQFFPEEVEELKHIYKDYFDCIYIGTNGYDLIFGALSSIPMSDYKSTLGRSVWNIMSEIAPLTYPPTFTRTIIAEILWLQNNKELSKSISCTSNMPQETALAGNVIFKKEPNSWHDTIYDGLNYEKATNVLDTELLIGEIDFLLDSEESLQEIMIGGAIQSQGFGQIPPMSNLDSESCLYNHYDIIAIYGRFRNIIQDLLELCIHFNWDFSQHTYERLSEDELQKIAKRQIERLDGIRGKANNISIALNHLQKRYPHNINLKKFSNNNIYSNSIKYSPYFCKHSAGLINSPNQFGYKGLDLASEELLKGFKSGVSLLGRC